MNFELISPPLGGAAVGWRRLIESAGLSADESVERTLLVYDGDELVATGSRDGCVLKLIAVADSHRGEDLTAKILTELRKDAFSVGYEHLFLYTKPSNRYMFESLFFYPIVETENVLVMENRKDGIKDFINTLPTPDNVALVGSAVMNCNPFTLGHRALIERAASECERVYVFVLSEDKSEFSFKDRLEMVKLGTADLPNVTVLATGPYLISSATFPTYFLKDRDRASAVSSEVDVKIFGEYFAKRLSITRRYVGTEPFSPLADEYNAILKEKLQKLGIEVVLVDRKCNDGTPISASAVRAYIKSGDKDAVKRLVPKTTFDYLEKINVFA